ncbi:MAG: hypothetical protein GX130_09575 [Candidatus Hydrogenedens sp.]|jgi:hypothetical protein|nr:hypothetical protein [Candidatus Hydrogenedens sp.]
MNQQQNNPPEDNKVKRRDFMRMLGTAAVGSQAGLSGSAEAQAAVPPSTFPKVAEIALPLTHPDALALTGDDHFLVGGRNEILLLDPQGKEESRHSVDGRVHSLLALDSGILLGFRRGVSLFDPATGKTEAWEGFNDRSCVTALTCDEDHVFVSDAGNRVVLRYDREGRFLNGIGKGGAESSGPGFIVPSPYFASAIDPLGMLWVINPGRHGLESFYFDGRPVSSWYKSGSALEGFCGCCNPIHIAWRSDHSLVTVEKGLNRVKVYAPDFSVRGLVAGPAQVAGLPVNLSPRETPPLTGLAIDSHDRIALLNAREQSISIFEEVSA